MLTTLEEKLDRAHAAIITIDVQNDFCNPDSDPAKFKGRDVSMHMKMIDGLLELVDEGRSAGIPIIHVRYEDTPWSLSDAAREQRWRQKGRREAGVLNSDYALCVPGTPGAEFFRLKPRPEDIIVTKHRYSAFVGTNLDLILRSLGRKSLIFCGGSTNICLESTLRDAFMLDYYCVVVSDCSPTPWGEEAYRVSLNIIALAFGEVITLKQARDIWERTKRRAAPAE